MSRDTALIVIDVQIGLIEDAFRRDEMLDAISRSSRTPMTHSTALEPMRIGLASGLPARSLSKKEQAMDKAQLLADQQWLAQIRNV